MNYFLILVITALLLTACISHQSVLTKNIPPTVIYQDEEKYADLDNLTQAGLLHTLGEVIIKDPIIGGHVPQTIDGDVLPTIAHRTELRSLDYRDYKPGVRSDIV
ncbi:MAG: hypothetical protein U0518_01295 [Candidatus Gracilibacteria bacterium]